MKLKRTLGYENFVTCTTWNDARVTREYFVKKNSRHACARKDNMLIIYLLEEWHSERRESIDRRHSST